MKLTADTDRLRWAVEWVARYTGARVLPVLGGVRVEASGDKVILSATDYDQWATVGIPATVHEDGAVVVSGRLLDAVTGALRSGTAELVAEDGGSLRVRCGAAKASLRPMVAEDWPKWPDVPALTAEVDATELAHALRAIHPLAAEMEDEAAQSVGAALEVSGDAMTAVGVNKYQIARLTLPAMGDGAVGLSASTVKGIGDLAHDAAGKIRLGMPTEAMSMVVATDGVRTLAGKVPDLTKLPNWQRLLAPLEPERTFTVDAGELARLVKAVASMPRGSAKDPHHITLTVADGGVTVGLLVNESMDGDFADVVPAEHEAVWDEEPWLLCCRPDWLLEVLAAFRCEQVRVELTKPTRPLRLVGIDDDRAAAIVMPVRMPKGDGS